MPSNFGALRAGDLRHQITIKQNQAVPNDHGILMDDWQPVYTTMAQYIPQSGTSYFQDAAINTKSQAIFRCRWRPDFADSSMVISSTFGDFSIVQTNDVDGLHAEIQYYCTSAIGNG
jgi:head-tail adaptor